MDWRKEFAQTIYRSWLKSLQDRGIISKDFDIEAVEP
ncbi:hypothetical protein LCGC14_2389150 [marine sediment metagenome]|uniref:Uncharacterized protein n=1 Tax=marine sediment metagenome TaxID=412755 RepID=A0A0F9BYT5_9ZZZZ